MRAVRARLYCRPWLHRVCAVPFGLLQARPGRSLPPCSAWHLCQHHWRCQRSSLVRATGLVLTKWVGQAASRASQQLLTCSATLPAVSWERSTEQQRKMLATSAHQAATLTPKAPRPARCVNAAPVARRCCGFVHLMHKKSNLPLSWSADLPPGHSVGDGRGVGLPCLQRWLLCARRGLQLQPLQTWQFFWGRPIFNLQFVPGRLPVPRQLFGCTTAVPPRLLCQQGGPQALPAMPRQHPPRRDRFHALQGMRLWHQHPRPHRAKRVHAGA